MESTKYNSKTLNEYKATILKLEGLKIELNELNSKISACNDSIKTFSSYSQKLIINGKPIDENKMEEALKQLNATKNNVNLIIESCNNQIKNYENIIQKSILSMSLEE